MDREHSGENGRPGASLQRRLVQGLLAANVVAALVLAVVTLGSDDASTIPVGATGSAAQGAAPAEPAASVPAEGQGDAQAPAAEDDAPAAADQPGAAPSRSPSPSPEASQDPLSEATPLTVPFTPPPGYVPVRGDTAAVDAGPFDLAVRFNPLHESFPQSRLTQLGLQAVSTSSWQSPTDTLSVSTFRFRDAAAAQTFVGDAATPWTTDPVVLEHDLHGVPDSRAFHQMDRGDNAQFAYASEGSTAFVVGLAGPAAADHSMELVHQLLHQLGA